MQIAHRLATGRGIWLRGRWATPLRLGVTLILLAVVVVRNDVWSLPHEIARADLPLLAGMLACSYLAWVVNTYRWQRILAAFRMQYGFAELFRLNLAGVFYSLALPGQVSGEVLKALRIAGRTSHRRVIFASIFLDRVYGLIGVAALGLVALALAPPHEAWVGSSPSLVVLLVVTLVGCLIVSLPWLPIVARSALLTRRAPDGALGAVFLRPIIAERGAPPISMLMVGCALGLAAQALTAAIHWGVALSLGVTLSPLALTWIFALGTILGMFPISLGGLGVREATYVGLLALYGVSAGAALALSLTMFAILVALGLTGGVLDLLARDAGTGSSGAGDLETGSVR